MKNEYNLFKRKDKKVWYFYFYDNYKRVFRSTGKRLKHEAKAYAEEFLKQERSTEITLEKYADSFFIWDTCQWIQRQQAKNRSFSKSMAKMRRGHLINYIFPKFGKYNMNKISSVEVENWLIGLPRSSQTKNHIMYTLTIIFREALREKKIKKNPLETIEALAIKAKKTDALTLEELKSLFPDDTDKLLQIWGKLEYAAMLRLMASSGIRLGEARALIWANVEWEKSAIFIIQAIKAGGEIGEPKANERRAIYIPDGCLRLLKIWQEQAVFTNLNDLVFYGEGSNKPLSGGAVFDAFIRGLKTAEIETAGRNLKVHSLRHSYNTLMRGILPEQTLREFTGHKSEAMTDHYDSRVDLESRLDKLSDVKKLIDGVLP